MLISIIVPAYNVDKYIGECIETLINQTYRDIEIILIDDFSTDNTLNILSKYKKIDSRILIIQNAENKGLSYVKNIGISRAHGDLITFVDGDDIVDINYIKILVEKQIETNCDIIACNYLTLNDSNKKISKAYTTISKELYSEGIFENYLNSEGLTVSSWGKLYKKSIFQTIKFPLGKIYEDSYIFSDIMNQADKVFYINSPIYVYRIRSNSITTSKEFKVNQFDIYYANEKTHNFISKNYQRLATLSKNKVAESIYILIKKYFKSRNKTQKIRTKLRNLIRINYKLLMSNSYFNFNHKLLIFVLNKVF